MTNPASRRSYKDNKKCDQHDGDIFSATITTNHSLSSTNQQNLKYQHEGQSDNKHKPTLIGREINSCYTIYNGIASIAIGRNLSKEAINNSFIKLISTTTTEQRHQIKAYYKQQYKFDIDHYINQNFKGTFKRILLYSMQNEMERDLYILTIGVKKMKDINCILPMLCIYESDYITKLMNEYQKGIFEKTLKEQIIKLTDNNCMLRSFLVSILNGSRKRLPSRLLETDAEFLNDILFYKSEWNTKDEIKFIDIFSRRSFEYLHALCASFESLTQISLIDAIKTKFGCVKNDIGYAINCILMYILDKKQFYRKLLMKGIVISGHKYILFWRIIINEMDYNLMNILNSYGLYEGGKSDVDIYNLKHFIHLTINKKDESTSKLLLKICKF